MVRYVDVGQYQYPCAMAGAWYPVDLIAVRQIIWVYWTLSGLMGSYNS